MGASVQKLDTSGWDADALARLAQSRADEAARKAFKRAKAGHPLADVLEGLTEASRAASEAPRWRMVTTDFGNGHAEAVLMRDIANLEKTLERSIERDLGAVVPRGEGDREASIAVAKRRAKREVRHKAKAMMVNSLWTLTYRALMTDRDLALKHLDAFRRRVGAVLGEWKYIAVLERQERGAWHIHLATHALPVRLERGGVKVKSWDVMRAIWRSVVGELGGNFDEAKRRKRWGGAKAVRGAGAIASYIAGYVAKDMDDSGLNRKRYSASKGIELPESVRMEWGGDVAMSELIALCFAAVGDRITRTWFDRERQVFFIESDDSEPLG